MTDTQQLKPLTVKCNSCKGSGEFTLSEDRYELYKKTSDERQEQREKLKELREALMVGVELSSSVYGKLSKKDRDSYWKFKDDCRKLEGLTMDISIADINDSMRAMAHESQSKAMLFDEIFEKAKSVVSTPTFTKEDVERAIIAAWNRFNDTKASRIVIAEQVRAALSAVGRIDERD